MPVARNVSLNIFRYLYPKTTLNKGSFYRLSTQKLHSNFFFDELEAVVFFDNSTFYSLLIIRESSCSVSNIWVFVSFPPLRVDTQKHIKLCDTCGRVQF